MIDLNLTLSMLELIQSIVKTAYSNATNAERYPLWKLDCPGLSDIEFFVPVLYGLFQKWTVAVISSSIMNSFMASRSVVQAGSQHVAVLVDVPCLKQLVHSSN